MTFRSLKYALMLALAAQSGAAFSQGMSETEKFELQQEVEARRIKQNAALAKWKTEKQGIFTVYSPPVGDTKIIVFQGDTDIKSPRNVEAMNRMAAVAESACPGFNAQKVEPDAVGAGARMTHDVEKNYCSFQSSRSMRIVERDGQRGFTFASSPYVFVLLLKPASDARVADRDLNMIVLSGGLMRKLTPAYDSDGTLLRKENNSQEGLAAETDQTVQSASASFSPTSLKAAMDAIPRANRPIGMAMREGEWDSYNMQVEYTNMVLFPGGVAITAACRNWNPQQSPKNITGCGTSSYTLSNGKVRFPGKSEAADLTDFTGFTAGKSVSIDVGNVSGGGASTYGASISQVSGGELLMTPSGDISSGDWVSNSISGSNYSGYAGNSTKGVTGKYYLDGFLIAVQDRNGQISIGFIGQKHESSDVYTYLNGEQFWK
jgi:hypothetical protein